MSVDPDDLSSVVRYALESTHATAVCPFHLDVTVPLSLRYACMQNKVDTRGR
jgi:hypothetical protein